MILDTIVETKKREVAGLKARIPVAALEKMAAERPPARDFAAALTGSRGVIIAEVKRRSPSRGMIRADVDPVAIARTYEDHGAAAVSVLTDGPFFGGSSEDLEAVHKAVALPVLRKEFIIDPYQILEARAIGADAILLIAAILTAEELRGYREVAASLGMASLVEVHDRKELETALASGAVIIGINNRNLKTFVTDIGNSLALAPLVPKGKIAVAESGIRTRLEVEALLEAGIGAFLIGETLMAAPDIGSKLEELLGK